MWTSSTPSLCGWVPPPLHPQDFPTHKWLNAHQARLCTSHDHAVVDPGDYSSGPEPSGRKTGAFGTRVFSPPGASEALGRRYADLMPICSEFCLKSPFLLPLPGGQSHPSRQVSGPVLPMVSRHSLHPHVDRGRGGGQQGYGAVGTEAHVGHGFRSGIGGRAVTLQIASLGWRGGGRPSVWTKLAFFDRFLSVMGVSWQLSWSGVYKFLFVPAGEVLAGCNHAFLGPFISALHI